MPCLHRNGEITGYTVVATISGEVVKSVEVDVNDGRGATMFGLNPITNYSFAVAAVNSAGTGPYRSIIVETAGECIHVVTLKLYEECSPTNYDLSAPDGLSVSASSSTNTNHIMDIGEGSDCYCLHHLLLQH